MNKHQIKPPPLTDGQKQLIEDYLSDNYKRCRQAIIVTVKRQLSPEEWEDYINAAHFALVKAARNYKPDKGTSFATFASMNIKSATKSQIVYDNRNKRKINKQSRSLEEPIGEGLYLKDVLIGVEDIDFHEYTRINKYLKTLSNDAKKVLMLRLQGYKYIEISEKLGFDRYYMKELLLSLQKYERVSILRRS